MVHLVYRGFLHSLLFPISKTPLERKGNQSQFLHSLLFPISKTLGYQGRRPMLFLHSLLFPISKTLFARQLVFRCVFALSIISYQ